MARTNADFIRQADGRPPRLIDCPTDRTILQALVDNADLVGHAADGCAFLLVRTTPELLAFLAEMDAQADDAEDNGDGDPVEDRKHLKAQGAFRGGLDDEEDNWDREMDSSDLEPDHENEPSLTSVTP